MNKPAHAAASPPRKRGRPRIHPLQAERPPELPPPTPPAKGRAHPLAPNHQEAIRSWSEVCRTKERPMAASSIAANEVLWNAWCQWLAAQALHWSDATSETIRTFLDGPAPSLRRRHRPPRNPAQMSSLTRIRYFRVLKGVYENAFIRNWITEAPTLQTAQPEYVPKDAQGGVLPPGVLARLQNTRQLQETFAPTTDSFKQWWLLRDRAAVALVAETGITTAELIELKLKHLGAGAHNILQAMDQAAQIPLEQDAAATPREIPSPDVATDNPCGARMPLAPVVLSVPPSLTLQGRSFVLPARVCEALLPWVKLREHLLTRKAATFTTRTERASYLREHSLNGPLFPSRQGRRRAPGEELSHDSFFPMESAAVYLIFKRAFAGLQPKAPKGASLNTRLHAPITAQGTSVIRNTLIQQWLRQLPEEQAQERAGFKTLEGMRVIARAAGITTRSADNSDGETTPEKTQTKAPQVDRSARAGEKPAHRRSAKGGQG